MTSRPRAAAPAKTRAAARATIRRLEARVAALEASHRSLLELVEALSRSVAMAVGVTGLGERKARRVRRPKAE